MRYLNPIEILGLLNSAETSNLENEGIKKAKRKLFAEIDLSDDGFLLYHGMQFSKAECEQAIEYIQDKNQKDFYYYLATNKVLNNFLANGNSEIFANFNKDSVFKTQEFINFISPFFAPNFDKELINAFEFDDASRIKAILKTSIFVAQNEINIAYKSLSNLIDERIADAKDLRYDIKHDLGAYNNKDVHEIVPSIAGYFPNKSLNSLPDYFQSQILKIADEINYLSLLVWEKFQNSEICYALLEYLLTLNVDGLDKPTFEDNFKFIKKKNDERINEEANSKINDKYAWFVIDSREKVEHLKNGSTTPESLLSWVNSNISILELNKLSGTFSEIKNQIALILRDLSSAVCRYCSDFDVSNDLLNRANNIIGLTLETEASLQVAKKQLLERTTKIYIKKPEVKEEISEEKISPKTTPLKKTPKSDRYNPGFVWMMLLFFVVGIIIWVNIKNTSTPESESYAKSAPVLDTSNIAIDTSLETQNYTPEPIVSPSPPVESKYKGNQLNDGASPLNNCFGKGSYSGRAELIIKNGGDYDAIVCLYSVAKARTIRNEYVRKNSTFKMSKIAQGDYKIRVFYGNDWNPTLINSCGTSGNFETDVNFSEFDRTEYFEDSRRGSTIATLTLYKIEDGNASSSSINQSEFFSK